MPPRLRWTDALGRLRRLARNRRGSMVTWTAVALVPMLVAVGMATDMARGYLMRAKLNAALDAAALAGGRVMNSPTRDDDIRAYFNANFPAGYMNATLSPLNIEVIQEEGKADRLRVSATATVPTIFMSIAHVDEFNVGTAAEVTRENLGLQLVMVLDVTGSMRWNGKIEALRTASQDLVDILFGNNATSDKLSVAIVPYSQAVNVGDLGDDFIDFSNLPPELRSEGNDGRRWAGCVQARPTPGVLSDDETVLEADAYDANLAPVSMGGKWKPYIYPHWNYTSPWWDYNPYRQLPFTGANMDPTNPGYVAPPVLPSIPPERQTIFGQSYRQGWGPRYRRDPMNPNNWQRYDLPSGGYGPNLNCPARLLDFTGSKTTLTNYIANNLNPQGWTIGNLGLVWGWRLLDPSPPFPNPVPYNDPQTIKALIMMTDGKNEIGATAYTAYGRLQPYGYPYNRLGVSDPADAVNEFNKRMKKICYAMKAGGTGGRDKVEVYTVILGSVATETSQQAEDLRQIYRNCASRAANAFLAPSNSDLQAAFQAIGNDLANLHLSR